MTLSAGRHALQPARRAGRDRFAKATNVQMVRAVPAGTARWRPDMSWVLGLAWVVGFSFLGWMAMLSILAHQGIELALVVVAAVLLPALGLWCVAKAGSQGGKFLLVMAVLVIVASDISVRGRAQGLDLQSAAKLAIWISGLLLLPWRLSEVRAARKDLPTFALLLFGLFALVSTVYSITPFYTFAAALAFLGLWVTAVVLATSVAPARALLWIVWVLLAMATASLLLYVVAPGIAMIGYENGRVPRLGGIFGNANVLGSLAGLTMLLAMLSWFHLPTRLSAFLTALVVPICGTCLVLTQSRTSVLALIAGILVVVLRRHALLLLPTLVLGISGVAVVYAYPAAIDTLIAFVARSGRVMQVTTFTGRTEIWQFVLSAIAKAPLLGYGFASTKELIPAGYVGPYGWTTASAHNLWLQAWVTTGAVGLAFILINQISAMKALKLRPLPLRDGVCAFVLVGGFLEAGPVGPSVSLITFIWIWATALSLQPTSKLEAGYEQGRRVTATRDYAAASS